jgi:TfoX/Sxy family transcriptional regulator of competence genes
MFGGLAFLHGGNMAVGVIGDELMVRVGPDATDAALARPGTRPFDFTGRPLRGWVVVAASALSEEVALDAWIDEGHAFAASCRPHEQVEAAGCGGAPRQGVSPLFRGGSYSVARSAISRA